jgi:hypothetical protein
MAIVYIEPRPKGRPEGTAIDDYAVETAGDVVLKVTKTQAEGVTWAKANSHTPHVARVRNTNKGKPDHWRAV